MYTLLTTPLRLVARVNDFAGRIGTAAAVFAIGGMVVVILVQVFFRYLLNNALSWPDELARFLMLWMTGLAAPIAFRRGGFVAIDSLHRFMPAVPVALLTLLLLVLSMLVLAVAVHLGWKHVASGWLFTSASLKIPLELVGLETVRIQLAWMYLSLLVGTILMLAVNTELILRQLLILSGGAPAKESC